MDHYILTVLSDPPTSIEMGYGDSVSRNALGLSRTSQAQRKQRFASEIASRVSRRALGNLVPPTHFVKTAGSVVKHFASFNVEVFEANFFEQVSREVFIKMVIASSQ